MNKINENQPGYKKTKVGWIPKDWDLVPLGSFGSFEKGKGISNDEKKESGTPCITYGEIYTTHEYVIKRFHSFIDHKTKKTAARIKRNAILFAGSGETLDEIGKCVAFTDGVEAYAGGDIVIFNPDNGDSIYLAYALNSDFIIRQKRMLGQGHSVVHIYSSGLKKLPLPIPPMLEQKKIAEILSTWDKAIQAQEKLIAAKKKLKKALMQQLLTGKRRLPGYTGEWKRYKLSQMMHRVVRPCVVNTGQTYRLISIRRRAGGIFERGQYAAEKISYAELHQVKESDFVISKRQVTHGALALVKQGQAGAYVSNEYTIFECIDPSKLYMNFLDWFAKQPKVWHLAYLSSNGVHIEKLIFSPRDFLKHSIRIPTDIKEQRSIATLLQTVSDEIALLENKLNALKKQKRGLMQKLLTGAIRVALRREMARG